MRKIDPAIERERRRKIGDAIRGNLRPDLAVRNRTEAMRTAVTKHGHSRDNYVSPTYNSWHSMIQRCTNPKAVSWNDYGGRGIEVCAQWRDFATFLADMGERPESTSIDRIDNDGNYEPSNCRWATQREQNAHRQRNKKGQFV